ncbi:uncharacterized protein LOC133294396 [Gastrolobium bilobum]|uniref:uncharacterized protein LOC133294396 n=1 Tax=Gastrolobium bilobum TaxID=150636 RepID=UPI002AB12F47|nr:uncharacterized protein LOC133294396 [Gastrolobium bilobum]
MEIHSPVIAKRLWNVLRITFFMIRKGLVSKRKLIMDMNLMMKKGKLLRKSLGNLMSSHHHHHSKSLARGGYGIQEYEFSCSNSPNPVFFHVPKRKHHFNFPCINTPEVIEEKANELVALECEEEPKAVVLVPKTPEYMFNLRFDSSVRVSNYSSEDENEEGGNGEVDDQAEDFIRRFYEQLRMQSRMQLLQYQ